MPLTRDVGLFGTGTRTRVLLLLALLGESHISEIARILGANITNIGKAVDSLELAGVVSGVMMGRTRRISFNPRYAYLEELLPLARKMATTNPALMEALANERRRPRRSGKEL
ncbi:ArsR family transcriptional regulator [bacterium]|nr:MAG: ArsR family transcriptional regulator [bacterium]